MKKLKPEHTVTVEELETRVIEELAGEFGGGRNKQLLVEADLSNSKILYVVRKDRIIVFKSSGLNKAVQKYNTVYEGVE